MDQRPPDWHIRPAVIYAVFFTGLGLSLAVWWVGLAWWGIVATLAALAKYTPWLLRVLLRL